MLYFAHSKVGRGKVVLRHSISNPTFRQIFGTLCFELKQKKIFQIGANLINPDKPPESFSELQKFINYTPSYTIVTDCGLQKTCWYMAVLRECGAKIKTVLVEHGLWKVFSDIEMPIVPVISGI